MELFWKLSGVFLTAFVVGFSGAMVPGPLLAFTINESSRRGMMAGPLIIVGHMLLEAALVAAVVVGLGGVLRNPVFVRVVSLAGGAVLLWMGQGMLRSARVARLSVAAEAKGGLHPVAGGILLSLSNPYWTIWWASIGAGYIVMGMQFGLAGVIAFFAGHILSDFVWYGFVSVGISQGRRLMSDRVYRWLMAGCGGALAVFAVWFLWTGITLK